MSGINALAARIFAPIKAPTEICPSTASVAPHPITEIVRRDPMLDEKELTKFFSASKSSLLFAVLFARKFQAFAIGLVNA